MTGIVSTYTDFTDLRKSWTEYSFTGYAKVGRDGDLAECVEAAREGADRSAGMSRVDLSDSEPEYDVFVRVVRKHRQGWSA